MAQKNLSEYSMSEVLELLAEAKRELQASKAARLESNRDYDRLVGEISGNTPTTDAAR